MALLDGQPIKWIEEVKYLEPIDQSNWDTDAHVIHRIRVGWTKWRQASGVDCHKQLPMKLKGKNQECGMHVAEMCILWFMSLGQKEGEDTSRGNGRTLWERLWVTELGTRGAEDRPR